MKCRLVQLFAAQDDLMRRFLVIEEKNGFRPPSSIPISLDDPHDQLRIKELAWRATEEIGETVVEMTERRTADDSTVREEMSDVLHFLLELFIVAGLTPDRWPMRGELDRLGELFEESVRDMNHLASRGRAMIEPEDQLAQVVWDLASATHELKNRPWKQTLRATDPIAFHNKLQNAMGSFILACLLYGISTQELFDLYFRKHQVNRTRQDTGV